MNQYFWQKLKNKLSDFGNISCRVSRGFILRRFLFFIYVNDIPQRVKPSLLLYAVDSYRMYQNKEIAEIDKILNEDFGNIYDGFVDNKLSLYFGDNKTKSIFFANKQRTKNICELNLRHTKLNI